MNKKSIALGKVGMNRDSHESLLKKEEYSFARNANILDESGNQILLQNEHSNILCSRLPIGFKVLNWKIDENADRTYLFLVNPETRYSEIGYLSNINKILQVADLESQCGCDFESILDKPLEDQTQVESCNYKILIRDCEDRCLNFNLCYPIRDVILKDEKCGKGLYFNDIINPPRVLYVNNLNQYKTLGYDTCGEETPLQDCLVDCNKLRVFKKFSKPCIKPEVIQEGGRLKAGVYEFMLAYCDKEGNELSQYYSITNPIKIFEKNRTILNQTVLDYTTTKSIRLTVKGLDTRNFSYYKVAVIQNVESSGSTDYLIEGIHNVDDQAIVYTSDIDTTKTTLIALLAEKPYYDTVEMMTTSNGMLFMGGLTAPKILNLQPVVNLMGSFLRWTTVKSVEGLYEDGVNTSKYTSLMRDENYPFGIRFYRANGKATEVYPFINRPPTTRELDIVNENTNTDIKSVLENTPNCAVNPRNRRWQYYNHATEITSGLEYNEFQQIKASEEAQFAPDNKLELACNPLLYSFGKFGYYESEETYPDNFQFDSTKLKIFPEDLADKIKEEFEEYFVESLDESYNLKDFVNYRCKPIRHYKTPDNCISPAMGADNTPTFFEDSYIYPMGVKIDNDVVVSFLDIALKNNLVTKEEREDLVSYEILRGDREANSSILGKGLLYDMYKYNERFTSQDAESDIYYSNYPYNDLSSDALHYKDQDRNTFIPHPYGGNANTKWTFHSPDTHFNYPTLGTELKVEGWQYGQSKGVYTDAEKHPKWVILGQGAYDLATVLATLEVSSEVLTKYGDFRAGQAMSADREVKEGKFDTGDPSLLEGSGFISGLTSLGTTQMIDLGVKGRINAKYKHLDKNTDPITSTEKWLFIASLIQQSLASVGQKRFEWLKVFEDNGQFHNFAYYYTSVAKYNDFNCISNEGEILRGLPSKKYIKPFRESIVTAGGRNNVNINNLDRESSVYLSVGNDEFKINYPNDFKTKDNSRLGSYSEVQNVVDIPIEEGQGGNNTERKPEGRSQEFRRDVASLYVSIKNYIPNQYGNLHSIKWLTTNSCIDLNSYGRFTKVFGGDTAITRFSLRRKMRHFFTDAMLLADRQPFNYYPYRNIGHPRYYIDYKVSEMTTVIPDFSFIPIIGSLIGGLLGLLEMPSPNIKSYWSVDTQDYEDAGSISSGSLSGIFKRFYLIPPSRFYLQTLGIPTFLCESPIINDYRYGGVEPEQNFYPNIADYADWTQPSNLSKKADNTFYYRQVYSKRVTHTGSVMIPTTYDKELFDCLNDSPNGVIWSEQDNSEQQLRDPWLNYKLLNKANLATSNGKLIDIRGIESQQILARFDNTFEVHNAIDPLKERVTKENFVLGTGGIFSQRPLQFAQTDSGYHGTQHKAMLSTPHGHFWVDAKRGHPLMIEPNAKGFSEFSAGLKQWFKEQLPFKLIKSNIEGLNDLNIDNSYNGYGIVMGYDERYERILVTKLDYRPKFKTCFDGCNFYLAEGYDDLIIQRESEGYVYQGVENCKLKFTKDNGTIFDSTTKINLTDTAYFEDASWTVGYSPLTKTWISYYDFKPQYFIPYHNYFKTGINFSKDVNEEGIWSHLLTNRSYQVFYGKKYPFEIELPAVNEYTNKVYQSTEYWLDSRRYHNEYDFSENRNIGFNKAVVYNHSNNSGIVELETMKKEEPLRMLNLLQNQDSKVIPVTMYDKKWTFNYLFNRVKNEFNNLPLWNYDISRIHKFINVKSLTNGLPWKDRLRGDWFLTRLVQDKESRFKIIFKWKTTNTENYDA